MSRFLLDTHALIWWLKGAVLSPPLQNIIKQNQIFVSVASVWEMAIKSALNKLENFGDMEILLQEAGFIPLIISFRHVERTKTLPHHHRDPFDRMLIAQALTEGMPIISNETAFDAYGVKRVWE